MMIIVILFVSDVDDGRGGGGFCRRRLRWFGIVYFASHNENQICTYSQHSKSRMCSNPLENFNRIRYIINQIGVVEFP